MKYIFSQPEFEDEIVAQMIDVLVTENLPLKWKELWEWPESRDISSVEGVIPRRPEGEREARPPLEEAFEEFVNGFRRKREEHGVFGEEETHAVLELMRGRDV